MRKVTLESLFKALFAYSFPPCVWPFTCSNFLFFFFFHSLEKHNLAVVARNNEKEKEKEIFRKKNKTKNSCGGHQRKKKIAERQNSCSFPTLKERKMERVFRVSVQKKKKKEK